MSESILAGLGHASQKGYTFTTMEVIVWAGWAGCCCKMEYVLSRKACFTFLEYSLNMGRHLALESFLKYKPTKLFSESQAK